VLDPAAGAASGATPDACSSEASAAALEPPAPSAAPVSGADPGSADQLDG
jgi:hypothetical protein